MFEHPDFLHFYRRSEAELRAFIRSLVRDPHAAAAKAEPGCAICQPTAGLKCTTSP